MGIGELLRNYGIIAVGFHFSVWVTCLAATFLAFSTLGDQAIDFLPPFIRPDELEDPSATSAGVVVRAALSVGVVETHRASASSSHCPRHT